MGEEQHRLGRVAHLALDEAGLVVGDVEDAVAAGDVAPVHDGEAGGVEVEPDAGDEAAGDGGADRSAVEHAGEDEVVHVPRRPGRPWPAHPPAARSSRRCPSRLPTWCRNDARQACGPPAAARADVGPVPGRAAANGAFWTGR